MTSSYHQFTIRDPKDRLITAPCFAERVLHHGIMNVCEPFLDRWLIADTFACRTGKGRVAALLRARQFAGRYPFFLKMDIHKYFDSIPHEGLLERLARRFKDWPLLRLCQRIVGAYRGELGRGVPVGSLTSQHFANFYLGWFDRFPGRVIRGGSWNNNGQNCRAANRNRNEPSNRNNNLGFRVARAPQADRTMCRTEPTAFPFPGRVGGGTKSR